MTTTSEKCYLEKSNMSEQRVIGIHMDENTHITLINRAGTTITAILFHREDTSSMPPEGPLPAWKIFPLLPSTAETLYCGRAHISSKYELVVSCANIIMHGNSIGARDAITRVNQGDQLEFNIDPGNGTLRLIPLEAKGTNARISCHNNSDRRVDIALRQGNADLIVRPAVASGDTVVIELPKRIFLAWTEAYINDLNTTMLQQPDRIIEIDLAGAKQITATVIDVGSGGRKGWVIANSE